MAAKIGNSVKGKVNFSKIEHLGSSLRSIVRTDEKGKVTILDYTPEDVLFLETFFRNEVGNIPSVEPPKKK